MCKIWEASNKNSVTLCGETRNISVATILENLIYLLFVRSKCRLQEILWGGAPNFISPPQKIYATTLLTVTVEMMRQNRGENYQVKIQLEFNT